MVHLYVLNPAHKLRFIARHFFKGSKRILKQVNEPSSTSTIPEFPEVQPPRPPKFNILDFIKADLPLAPHGGLTRDNEYYRDDSEGGFCIFRVENTLFKVHKCYLLREPSAFGDMFSLPAIPGNREGLSDDAAVTLSDTAEQFQDLLWALYATPTQLYSTSEADWPSIERLLNIAETTNKYCIASYETWALDRIVALAQNPMGFLRHGPPEICARALNIAALCNHQMLLDIITQRLVPRILWSDVDRQAILKVAESRGLRKIQGVAYYRELIDMENASDAPRKSSRAIFPPSMDVEKRMLFLAAHHSLVNFWECIKATPPTFIEHGCPAHTHCLNTWTELWLHTASSPQTQRHGSADILGKLKSMMILLKKSTRESDSIGVTCSLAALESITTTREDIIAGLMEHFQGY
ncbi:hypothetical protein GALMADRAFT_134458 [Galerina marginata CBS 339.88]|uniref:BTB domain-containing protein n=1 Tax=Galerina marginata (strain CBS 339.88) TaxID=685588 RepID=A0A067TIB5_GALM3|nr:hypothetical protein GALMADRAFT_134458 [Galerina marginata CBS 339.88]